MSTSGMSSGRSVSVTSLDFTSQLTSLFSTPSTTSHTTARTRPSKSNNKTDALFSAKVKRKPGAKQPNGDSASSALTLKSPTSTEEEKSFLASARRKMEEKMVADVLTKPLGKDKFERFRSALGLVEVPG